MIAIVPVLVLIGAVLVAYVMLRDLRDRDFCSTVRTSRCQDCGAPTPGGRRCWPCADEHVDAVVRYDRFCHAWTRIGLAEYRRSLGIGTHGMGVYR